MTGTGRDKLTRVSLGIRSVFKARSFVPVVATAAAGIGLVTLGVIATTPAPSPAATGSDVVAQKGVEIALATPLAEEAAPYVLALADVPSVAASSPDLATPTVIPLHEGEARAAFTSRGGQRTEIAPTPAPTPTPRRGTVKHVVAEGETLGGIADQYDVTTDTIVSANAIDDPESLAIGQELRIPPFSGTMYTVAEGDTLSDLASAYGVIPEDIVAANNLPDADSLQIGHEIIIPSSPMHQAELDSNAGKPAEDSADEPLAPSKYVVAEGDSLSAIAGKFGISTDSLIWSNPSLGDGNNLRIDQTLIIPPVSGVLHTVNSGDTLTGVAARYDVEESEIAKANGLSEPYMLQLGQVLVVPGGTPPEPVAEAAPAPAPTSVAQPAAAKPAAPKPAPEPAPAAAPPASGAGPAAADIAMKYIGWAYIWGGASPSAGGFDCSGLTYYAFRQAGRPIPRDLWGQVGSGARVARGDLQVGDLVFFQNTYTYGLSHVGIYVGGGRFLHAGSQHSGILISSLGDSYWSGRYYGASRP